MTGLSVGTTQPGPDVTTLSSTIMQPETWTAYITFTLIQGEGGSNKFKLFYFNPRSKE